jgi:5-methylcytosine-specific restriction protein A
MIPVNISTENILEAIGQVDADGVPAKRQSTKFILKHNDKFYPPKYVLSLSNVFANGQELSSDDFSGGDESNTFLEARGFEIIPKDIFSWEIISDDVIAKTLDKSAFLHHGTDVPREIISFFNIHDLAPGKSIEVFLKLAFNTYTCRLEIDREEKPRVQLLWRSDFGGVFKNHFRKLYIAFKENSIKDQASLKLVFEKTTTDNVFQIKFDRSEPINIKQGSVLSGKDICSIFACSPQGGMRRGKKKNSLVIMSDHTNPLCEDRWQDDTFHYTGMGTTGDQSLDFNQNKTLYHSDVNGVDVHLFEVYEKGQYIYQGKMCLADEPYQELQEDADGKDRQVWVFPLRLVSEGGPVAIPEKAYQDSQKRKAKVVAKLTDEELLKKAQKTSGRKSKRSVESKVHERNLFVAEYAKRRAGGICQLCEESAPFKNKKGEPYLESHHIIWLSKGGEDTIENTVALCPNCHKKVHILNRKNDIEKLKVV